MIAKIAHAFRAVNGTEAKVNSIYKVIDGKLVLVWPLAAPFYINLNTLFGTPAVMLAYCANGVLSRSSPAVPFLLAMSPELAEAGLLHAVLPTGLASCNELKATPTGSELLRSAAGLISTSEPLLREILWHEGAPILSGTSRLVVPSQMPIVSGTLRNQQSVNAISMPLLVPTEDLASAPVQTGNVDTYPAIDTSDSLSSDAFYPPVEEADILMGAASAYESNKATTIFLYDKAVLDRTTGGAAEKPALLPQEFSLQVDAAHLSSARRALFSLMLDADLFVPVANYGSFEVAWPITINLVPLGAAGQLEDGLRQEIASAQQCIIDAIASDYFDTAASAASFCGHDYDVANLLKQHLKAFSTAYALGTIAIDGAVGFDAAYLSSTANQATLPSQCAVGFHQGTCFVWPTVAHTGSYARRLLVSVRHVAGSSANATCRLSGSFFCETGAQPSMYPDAHPTIRLPIEARCGAVVSATGCIEHTPNVFECVDLDHAHVATIDNLSLEAFDRWPVRSDDGSTIFRYQLT